MTRKKVKLAYISNDSARKATFKKRKKGLLKKVKELSTLCDVDACAVIYSPYDAAPEVHPSPLGAQRVLARFRRMPEMDQSKKMVNQDGFLRQRIAKAVDQLKKLRKDNRDKELTRLMLQALPPAASAPAGAGAARVLQGLSVTELNDLGWLIEQNLKDVSKKLDKVGGKMKREVEEMQAAEEEEEKKTVLMAAVRAGAGSSRYGGVAAQAGLVAKKVRSSLRGRREAVVADEAAEERAAGAMMPGFGGTAAGGSVQNKHQWFMELMMNHNQEHHDQMVNLAFGDQSSGQYWANGFYP